MNRDHASPPPLTPDDPRLSEWIDGRLTVAEAAEIERLVAASPELTRLVADLRGIRGALGAMPVTPPPAGFVRDVLAALDGPGAAAADEADVEEEWRRIERQRLDEEIAAAEDDLTGPVAEPMRRRWPWMALAGALAAGVLVTVVINRPQVGRDREVALVEHRDRDRLSREESQFKGLLRRDGGPVGGLLSDGELRDRQPQDRKSAATWNRRNGAGLDGREREALDIEQRSDRQDTRRLADGTQLAAGDSAAGLQASGGPQGFGAGPRSRATASGTGNFGSGMVAGGGGGGGPGDGGGPDGGIAAGVEKRSKSGPPLAARAAATGSVQPVRAVTYRIRTAADRLRLEELLASHAGMRRWLPADPGKNGNAAAAAPPWEAVGEPPRSPPKPANAAPGGNDLSAQGRARERAERLVFSGPPEALDSLAAAIESAQGSGQGAGKPANRSANPDAAAGRYEEAKAADQKASAKEAAPAEALARRAGPGSEGSAADRADFRPGRLPGAPQVEVEGAASAEKSETAGLLVIEIVDESGVAGGEVQP